MSNPLVAAIRSMVQAVASLAVVAGANVALTYLGVELDTVALTESLSLGAFGALVWAFNALGTRFPVINTVLSLGFGATAPVYDGE